MAAEACQKGVERLSRLTSVLEQSVRDLNDMLKSKLKKSELDIIKVFRLFFNIKTICLIKYLVNGFSLFPMYFWFEKLKFIISFLVLCEPQSFNLRPTKYSIIHVC